MRRGQPLFRNDHKKEVQKGKKENDSRYEMRLISIENKEKVNWVLDPNNAKRERENEKENEQIYT